MFGGEIMSEFLISEARFEIVAHVIHIGLDFLIAPISPEPFTTEWRHWVYAPMHENAHFCSVIPQRQGTRVQTVPRRIVCHTIGTVDFENLFLLAQNYSQPFCA